MDAKELKDALETLSVEIQGKTKTEIKTLVDAFEVKFKDEMLDQIKKGQLADSKETKAEFKKLQDHIDSLDAKLKLNKKVTPEVTLETKVVTNMTLASALTGDQPRVYSNQVAAVPNQLLNIADLISSITISGGTYTFPRETGKEGTVTTQVEGADKSQNDYDLAMIDVNTDFIAGFCVYSKKMANNLPFLESFLPMALRRDYWKGENAVFNTALSTGVTASTEIITGKNKIEMLINEVATLESSDFAPNGIVVTPSDFYSILKIEKSTGAGYGLPGVVTFQNGQLRVNGIPVFKATWLAANKYYVGDWTRVKKVVTEGLSVEFSEVDSDNFRKNNITARVEAQVGLAIERVDALIYGDFTAV